MQYKNGEIPEEKPIAYRSKLVKQKQSINPGGWSTNKKLAWGGVALDLFPHLYTQLINITPWTV